MCYFHRLFFLCLLLAGTFILGYGYCQEKPHAETEDFDWRFVIDSNRVNVEVVVTIHPRMGWSSVHEYYTASAVRPQNFSAWDFKTKSHLETKILTDSKFTNLTVFFTGWQPSGYRYVLSYYFEPTAWTGGGTYFRFLHWRWGYGGQDKTLLSPQNVKVVLPPNCAFDYARLGPSNSAVPLEVTTFEEQGRTICKFSGASPGGGYFEWTVYYKLPPESTSTSASTASTTMVTPQATKSPETGIPSEKGSTTATGEGKDTSLTIGVVTVLVVGVMVTLGFFAGRRYTRKRGTTDSP